MRPAVRAAALSAAVLAGAAGLAGAGTSGGALPAPVGTPGSAWGGAGRDLSGFEGYGTQGWVRQGVRWPGLPGGVGVQTAAAYRWRVRTENRRFYDAHGPALTVEFDKSFVNWGLDLAWQRYPRLGRTDDRRELFLGWYKRLVWARAGRAALPAAAWGRLSRDLDGFEGNGAMGWLSQGVESPQLPGGLVARALASYRWRLRSRERLFYNVHGPALGLELSGGGMDLGIENVWRRYPELGRSESALQLYLNWYFAWDLSRH